MPYNDWEWGLDISKYLLCDIQKFGPSFAVSKRQVIFRMKVIKLWSETLSDNRLNSYLNSEYSNGSGESHRDYKKSSKGAVKSRFINISPSPYQKVLLPQVPHFSSFIISKSVCHIPIAITYFPSNKLFAKRPFRQKCQGQDRQCILIKLNWK